MSKKKSKLEEILKEGVKATKEAFTNVKKAANIGTKKISIYMLRNQMRDKLSTLGLMTLQALTEDKADSLNLDNNVVKVLVDEIENLKEQIKKVEEKIDDINEESKK